MSVAAGPVDAIAPGVWSILLPLTGSPTGSVFVYLLRHDRGLLLIDTGYDDDPSRTALMGAVQKIGHELSEVTAIVLTHNHPDHVGMSNRLHGETGAWVALNDRDWPQASSGKRLTFADRVTTELELAGVPAADMQEMILRSLSVGESVDQVQVDRALADGDVISEGGLRLEVVASPGHADGHVCLLDRERGLLFSGDLLLATGEIQLSIINDSDHDPVHELRDSMQRIAELGVTEALPGHQRRIENLQDRVVAATAELDRRSAQVAHALAGRPGASAWELVPEIDWGRPWPRMRPLGRQFAVMQTFAHLRRLETEGALRRSPGPPERYWRSAGAAALQTG